MISLVGAGPGDLELITVRGQRRLQEADVVIYDRLVNPLLLFHCKPECQFIYVGKTPYQSTMEQEKINQQLIDSSKKNQRVVRLKGGDPEIFGRLTEELEVIVQEKIPFEIIPGITSASGTAAYNGIPLTERETARSVSFMTGTVKAEEKNNFPVLGENQTVCLYMGVQALEKFIPHLLKQGFHNETKIAVISWGTYGRQQKVIATLATIIEELKKTAIKNPAMILIGEVVKRSQEFGWFERLPQYGERILLVASRAPKIEELISYTEQGADIWWHQVGSNRDQRFDKISERYLEEQSFDTILFIDEQAEKNFEEE